MLNVIWAGMILIGIVFAAFTGNLSALGTQVFDSAKESVSLSLTMLGTMAFWCGLMEIADQSGLLASMTRAIRPAVRWLFPGLPEDSEAGEYIAMNMIANFLGLGSAATPAGLKAMEKLAELEEERREFAKPGVQERPEDVENNRCKNGQIPVRPPGVASNEMCTFLILNISSLQLIPVNMIAYRSQYGSVNPTAIVGPGIAATAVSTAVAILFCKIMDRNRSNGRGI